MILCTSVTDKGITCYYSTFNPATLRLINTEYRTVEMNYNLKPQIPIINYVKINTSNEASFNNADMNSATENINNVTIQNNNQTTNTKEESVNNIIQHQQKTSSTNNQEYK